MLPYQSLVEMMGRLSVLSKLNRLEIIDVHSHFNAFYYSCFAPGDFDSEFLDFLTTYSVFIIVSLLGFNMIVKMSLFVRAAIMYYNINEC